MTTIHADLHAEKRAKCTVEDGRFVIPCDSLERLIDNKAPGFSRTKGVSMWTYSNLRTAEPTRSFVGVKCRTHPNGFLFNFCPVCGEKIDAPFVDRDNISADAAEGGAA